MSFKKSFFRAILILFAAVLSAQATKDDLTKRYIELAESQYEKQAYEDAYSSINAALKLNQNNVIPANLSLVAVQIYSKVLDNMASSKDYSKLPEIENNIELYPSVADSKIQFKLRQLQNQKQEDNTSFQMIFVVIVVCAVILVILAALIVIFKLNSKNQQNLTKQFEETLKVVSGIQQANGQLLLGSVTELSGVAASGLKSAGSGRWAQDALPSPELTIDEKNQLKMLAVACEELGSKIDGITKRKNNSKNVSEMVYKLAVALGCNQNTAMAYFCASMVYDAGFLAVPEQMLGAESLTEQEKELIHDHVNKTGEFFDFVPAAYRRIFDDAARFHHENEDGSGYPDGIKGGHIPQIAKLIHVVESYNSLISRRNYRAITDKESAVKELLSKPELYDAAVVKALDSIV